MREYAGSRPRSREFYLVAYFFSRCGTDGPPSNLGVATWMDAYRVFYRALSAGRSETQFRNSMKNARDEFDPHVRGGRVGWNDGLTRRPRPLNALQLEVIKTWQTRSSAELWDAVKEYCGSATR